MKRVLIMFQMTILLASGCAGGGGSDPDGGSEWDGNVQPPDFYNPGDKPEQNCSYGYGEDCPDPTIDCASDPCIHGECIDGETESNADFCLCDEGYAGLLCERCARGYFPDGLVCVKGGACEESPCVFGTCYTHEGEIFCECYEGYTGEYCDQCADGYHIEGIECVPD